MIKKANKKLYTGLVFRMTFLIFIVHLRPVLENCAPVFHHSLPAYWSDDVEGVQKRALSIINPLAPFLSCCKLSSLKERRCSLCEKLFNSIMLDSSHKLYKFLPQKNINTYNLRRPHHFKAYNACTNRFKNSLFSTMVKFFLGYL